MMPSMTHVQGRAIFVRRYRGGLFMSNRVLRSYEDIVALSCQAWNNLIDQPWKIMSIGLRDWAHRY